MYNDKGRLRPTVSTALDGIFGRAPAPPPPARRPANAPVVRRRGARRTSRPGTSPGECSRGADADRGGAAAGGVTALSPAKSGALQELQTALGAVKDAQRSGNFAQYGAALQRLDDAMNKYEAAK